MYVPMQDSHLPSQVPLDPEHDPLVYDTRIPRRRLPSRRFLLAFLILLVGIGALLLFTGTNIMSAVGNFFKNSGNTREELDENGRLMIGRPGSLADGLNRLENQDSDGDGLYDWQESLWGTNPNLADSDGDGLDDRDEVRQIQIEREQARIESGEPIADEPLSEIDYLSRDVYAAVAILTQQEEDGVLDKETFDELTGQVIEDIQATLVYPQIDITGLNLVTDSPENLLTFITEFGNLLDLYPPSTDDFIFLANASLSENESQESLEVLTRYEALYADLTVGLIEVPISAQGVYIEYVNGVAYLISAMESILDAEENPVRGLAGVNRMQDAVQEYLLGIEGVAQYIYQNIPPDQVN